MGVLSDSGTAVLAIAAPPSPRSPRQVTMQLRRAVARHGSILRAGTSLAPAVAPVLSSLGGPFCDFATWVRRNLRIHTPGLPPRAGCHWTGEAPRRCYVASFKRVEHMAKCEGRMFGKGGVGPSRVHVGGMQARDEGIRAGRGSEHQRRVYPAWQPVLRSRTT